MMLISCIHQVEHCTLPRAKREDFVAAGNSDASGAYQDYIEKLLAGLHQLFLQIHPMLLSLSPTFLCTAESIVRRQGKRLPFLHASMPMQNPSSTEHACSLLCSCTAPWTVPSAQFFFGAMWLSLVMFSFSCLYRGVKDSSASRREK